MNALQNKLANLSIEQLGEIAAKMNKEMTNEAGIILEACLDALMGKMDEADFVRFCNKLAA